MAVNILGGKLKGLSLRVPKGDIVRPTSVLLKRRMFDSHQDFSSEIFIDACAGTGAIGLEAWSRGAKRVLLVEPNKNVLSFIKQNVTYIKDSFCDDFKSRPIEVIPGTIQKWFSDFYNLYSSFSEADKANTIFFFDPPYELLSVYEEILFVRFSGGWFKGEIWIESDTQKGKSPEFWLKEKITEIKRFRQGTSYLLRIQLC